MTAVLYPFLFVAIAVVYAVVTSRRRSVAAGTTGALNAASSTPSAPVESRDIYGVADFARFPTTARSRPDDDERAIAALLGINRPQ